jgi:hypothetical protein
MLMIVGEFRVSMSGRKYGFAEHKFVLCVLYDVWRSEKGAGTGIKRDHEVAKGTVRMLKVRVEDFGSEFGKETEKEC